MYKDFHYYGTYVAACYAGYSTEEAQIIAHAAQYVDDSVHDRLIKEEGYQIGFQQIPTVHDAMKELSGFDFGIGPSLSELYQVWVPFHFLPGNYTSKTLPDPNAESRIKKYDGPKNDSFPHNPSIVTINSWEYDAKAEMEFKHLCLPDSPIAMAMINDIINNDKKEPYELHLIGIRMHVLADTAAHAYYAGIPAWHVNDMGAKVYDLTVSPKKEIPWQPDQPGEQCTPALTLYYDSIFYQGHARMGSIPDYPWIRYEYNPRWSSTSIVKDNPVEHLKIFRQMVTALKCIREKKAFEINSLEPIDPKYLSEVENILRQRHNFGLDNFGMTKATDIRCGWWKNAIKNGKLGPIRMPEEYNPDAWLNIARQRKPIVQTTDYYKFNKAATIHLKSVKEWLQMDGIIPVLTTKREEILQRVSRIPNEIASELRKTGYKASEVAGFLKNSIPKVSAEFLAETLKKAGYGLNEIGNALKEVGYGINAIASALKKAGYNANETAKFLKDSIPGVTAEVLAGALKNAGYGLNEITNELKNLYGFSADALKKVLEGAGYAGEEIGNFFKSMGGEFAELLIKIPKPPKIPKLPITKPPWK